MRHALLLPILISAACSDATPRVVTIGDNVGSNPTFRTSYVGLLIENDDQLFPAFSGKNLAQWAGGEVDLVRLDRGGDSYHNIAAAEAPYCTCSEESCLDKSEPCLDTASSAQTTILVQLGGNDLFGAFLGLINDEQLRADPSPLFTAFEQDINRVLDKVSDPTFVAESPQIFVTTAYDPSDGVGDMARIAASILPPNFNIDPSVISPELALSVLDRFNTIVRSAAAAKGATVIDAHQHFLGHGYHFDDMAHANYHGDDASQWIRGVFDPTLRGAHELRRLIWRSLSGENISDLPKDLPADILLDLPAVPADGWAKAVVEAKVTEGIYQRTTDVTWPNAYMDASVALGVPENAADYVAVGVIGAYLVLDLGEATQAIDGEGDDLVVLELGAKTGGTPEPYRVSVSSSPTGPFTPIADARGERSFDLGVVGVRSARYVKIDSLVSEVDIFNGLGSPVAPGPEIVGAGAIHPGTP